MYEWSEMDLAIQDAIRQFVDTEIRPLREEFEFGDLPPYDTIRKLFKTFGIDTMAAETLAEQLAKEREGSGSADARPRSAMGGQEGMAVILVKELCRVCPGFVGGIGVSLGLGASTIMCRGTLAQKQRWLPGLVTFEKVAAWAITEPGSGSDAFGSMKTTARRDGDGYVLNGQKTFITNGPYADVIVVYAKLDDGVTDPRERKILTFVLDTGMPGLTQGKPLHKMGLNSSPTGELFFEDVHLEADRLLGETEDHTSGDGRDSAKSGVRRRAHGRRRDVARNHRGMPRPVGQVREGTRAVRPSDRRLPTDPAQAGEDGDRTRQRAEHGVPRDRDGTRRQAAVTRRGIGGEGLQLAGALPRWPWRPSNCSAETATCPSTRSSNSPATPSR